MPPSTLDLSAFETRLNNVLNDSGSILWTLDQKDEALRLALADLSAAAGAQLTITDLDTAAATTIDARDEATLIRGAAAYAARTRAIDRSQAANLDQSMPNSLLTWANTQAAAFQVNLIAVKVRYQTEATGAQTGSWEWDETDKKW